MQTSSLQRRRITGAHAFFLGALLALFALAPAILPYGGRFVTRGDFIEQQLPFILETRRILRGGLNSYSFNTFLGAPAVGSYAFYTLGSVFVWPLALLPKALIPFGISVMAVLKHAVCALTSFCYLRRMIRDERLALLGCVLYAFSGFTVVNTQFYHFTEVIAFFPLILLGMEDAMGERPRRGLLALFCGLNTLTNYYFMLSSANAPQRTGTALQTASASSSPLSQRCFFCPNSATAPVRPNTGRYAAVEAQLGASP